MWGVCPGCGCGRDTVVVSHAGELVVMACLWCGAVWPATVPIVDAEALLARFSGVAALGCAAAATFHNLGRAARR